MPKLTWSDLEDIALALYDKFPEQDPSYIRFTDLHKWITELEGFSVKAYSTSSAFQSLLISP